jgi:hypothetical protein
MQRVLVGETPRPVEEIAQAARVIVPRAVEGNCHHFVPHYRRSLPEAKDVPKMRALVWTQVAGRWFVVRVRTVA